MMRVDKCADQNERMNRSGGEMIMAGNDTKIMQDKTAASIICSKCGMIIVPAQKNPRVPRTNNQRIRKTTSVRMRTTKTFSFNNDDLKWIRRMERDAKQNHRP